MGGKDATFSLLEFMRVIGWLIYILLIQVSFTRKFSDYWKKVEKEGSRFVEKVNREIDRVAERRLESRKEETKTVPPPPPPVTVPPPPPPSSSTTPPPPPPPSTTTPLPPSSEPPISSTLPPQIFTTTSSIPSTTSEEIDREIISSSIDPLIFTGALISIFIAIVYVIRKSQRPSMPQCDPPSLPRGERYYESYESMRNQNRGYEEYDRFVNRA